MRYLVVFHPTELPVAKAAITAATGMKILDESDDHVSCEGGYLAGSRLRSLCDDKGWRFARIESNRFHPLAALCFMILILLLLIASWYGTAVYFSCNRADIGGGLSEAEATFVGTVTWLSLLILAVVLGRFGPNNQSS